MKTSADQDNCSDRLILVLMTPMLGPNEVKFGSAWILSWL